jgi:hypothetical protein
MAKNDNVDTVKTVPTSEYEQVIADLRDQLKNAETVNDRLRISLELQEAKTAPTDPMKPSGIVYGPSFNPPNILEKVAVPYTKAEPDQHFRYISTHPSVYALRRGQGYEPVLDAKGAEVRQGDVVLAKMPKARFNEEVLQPRQDSVNLRKEAIEQRFHDEGKSLGVKTFGKISYDGANE